MSIGEIISCFFPVTVFVLKDIREEAFGPLPSAIESKRLGTRNDLACVRKSFTTPALLRSVIVKFLLKARCQ